MFMLKLLKVKDVSTCTSRGKRTCLLDVYGRFWKFWEIWQSCNMLKLSIERYGNSHTNRCKPHTYVRSGPYSHKQSYQKFLGYKLLNETYLFHYKVSSVTSPKNFVQSTLFIMTFFTFIQ